MATISVVVPVHNAASYLERCLASLTVQRVAGCDVELILVDNNSTDASVDIIKRFPGVRLLHEPRQGAYAARNTGVRASRGEVLAFTDPDCVPEAGWLDTLVRAMAGPDVAVVLGGYALPSHSSALRLLVRYENTKDEFVFSSGIPELYYGHTNNMALRRTTFDAVGPFVERRRGSDTILVRRVTNTIGPGAVRYCAAARVLHLEVDGVLTYYRKMATYGQSRESYRSLSWTRPLNARERVEVFRRIARSGELSLIETGRLFCLLSVGMLAWRAGRERARLDRLIAGGARDVESPPRTPPRSG